MNAHGYVEVPSSEETETKNAMRGAKLGLGISLLCFTAGYLSTNLTQTTSSAATEFVGQAQAVSHMKAAFLHDDVSEIPAHIERFQAEEYQESKDSISTSSTLSMIVYNEYTKSKPIETGTNLYPWTYLAEPNRATTMEVDDADSDSWYKWTVDGHVQGYGSSCEVLFTEKGEHQVMLVEKTATATSYLSVKVMVKYVRREIRSLTDLDREKFFNAVHILARVPTETGQELFGANYKSKDYFNRVHLYYGGTADCDHWHQGAGFVTSHVTFTLEYEMALQTVFPDIAQPYWDFTLESTFYRADDWRSSPIFSDSWFGDASPDNNLHTVTDGRWAYETAMTNARNFSQIVNSYGVLRAPWNNDPTPFMTRHDHVYGYMNNMKPSGCKEYYIALRKSTWMSMSKQLNAAAHGHIHETIGGSWNHYYADRVKSSTVGPAVLTFAHEIQALSKELWRAGYISCPEECAMDTAWEDCQCEFDSGSYTGGKTSYEILDEVGILAQVDYYDEEGHKIKSYYDANGTIYYTLPGYTEEASKHIYDELLEMLAVPGHIGDMFQATSSNDITFWVLHGTVDRLWHYKRLGPTDNYDETWDPYHTCYGHNPSNFQPFKNIFDSNDNYYTNAELYENLRPDKPVLQYMYDSFDWPHCELLGYDMSNEW